MIKVSSTIIQLNISGTITQLGVSSTITQKGVESSIAEAGYTPDPPIFVSAVVENANPDIVVITFDETLDEASIPATTAFSLSGITGDPSVTDVAISGTDVSLTLSGNVSYGDVVTLSYTKPGSNPLQDADGDDVNTFTDEPVTNNVEQGYCDEYMALYDEFTNKPSDADAVIQNTMVEAYIAANLWGTKCDRRNFTAIHTNDAGEAQLDWIDPINHLPILNVNGCSFEPYAGLTGDGATSYLDHQYTPSVDGVNYLQDSASQILYIRTNTTAGSHGIAGDHDTYITNMYNNNIYTRINDNGNLTETNLDGSGEYVNTRPAVNVKIIYRNKINIGNIEYASTGLPNIKFFSNALNNAGVAAAFRADQLSKIAFGAGYTQEDVDNEFDIFKTYLTNYGTQVA